MSHCSLNADILKIRHWNVTAVYRRCIDSVFSFLSTGCQIGLGASVNHELQVSLQIFWWLLVRALGGPLEDIRGFVPKPAHDPGCVSVGVAGRWIFAPLCCVFSSRTCPCLAPFTWWCHDGAVVWCSGTRWRPGNEHHLGSAGLNALASRPENYISVSLDLRKHCLLKSRWVAICLFTQEKRMGLRWWAVES